MFCGWSKGLLDLLDDAHFWDTAVSLGRSAGGSYCKVRNNNMKVLDLALVALLQPPVSNKIPGYLFFSKLDHQPQGGTINAVFCACLTNAKGNAGLVSYLSKSAA